MKQVLVKNGAIHVEEVSPPLVEPGTVLVRVDHSCISIGTELASLKSSQSASLSGAALTVNNLKKVVRYIRTRGIGYTKNLVKTALSTSSPLGYSAAGVVMEVGEGVDDLRVGDRVACAGAQCANHAEIIRVPRNLTVPVPTGLSLAEASTVTLGSIALQGIRRASPSLGESFVVIGLGVLGQITTQILKANGCQVYGTDTEPERIKIAEAHGLDQGIHEERGDIVEQVMKATAGLGADGVIVTAATPSDSVISTAFKMCRRKGRVVLVGDVGLKLNRADFYAKELDFFISTSYGPGRYDNIYEEQGVDYPVAYVRWTENRNMIEYLRLLADGRVVLKDLIEHVWPVEQATSAYQVLAASGRKPLMALFCYQQQGLAGTIDRRIMLSSTRRDNAGRIRIAIIGGGNFAKAVHLPNIQSLQDQYAIRAIVSRTGHNARTTAVNFGADYSTTDYQEVLDDSEVDAVLICTRHHQHAEMTLRALCAGKHVLVEKPLAVTITELEEIESFYNTAIGAVPLLLTGFNRRFSPYIRKIKHLISRSNGPLIMNYRMNAGYLAPDHWVHNEEGGGRNIGEACHIYDVFTYITGAKIKNVEAFAIDTSSSYYSHKDNFVVVLKFADGSLANLIYTALGDPAYPKEKFDIFVDGMVISLTDYKTLEVTGRVAESFHTANMEKGHKEEVQAFADAVSNTGKWPIELWEQLQVMQIAFQVEKRIST
ncbi:MAG: oxidoreductase [Gammaproteobacteria bacterium]|nr:oxidoreductase [Gammaproteobacteria bacterium]